MAANDSQSRRAASDRHPSRIRTRSNHLTTAKTDLDRLESLSKIVAAVAIPVVLGIGTWAIQDSQTKQSVTKDYVNLAIQILAKKAEPDEEPGLRSWAVALLDKKSPVPLAPELAARLTSGVVHLATNSAINSPLGYDVGNRYLDSRRYDLAIEAFDLAEKEDPTFSMTYLMRGLSYYGKHDYPKAISDFTRLTQLNSSNKSGFWQRGLSFFETKDYRSALADFSKTLAIDPKDSSAYYQRGLSYAALENTEQALADFTRAIVADDGHVLAHFERGKIYLKTEQYSLAVPDFTRVVDYERKFNDQHGILKEAETDLERAKNSAGG
jgi:tetratricopeptide (TPR) repeat protein